MELLVFSLFAAALLVCVIFHISLLFALLLGYVIFALYAIRKGFSLPEVLGMSAQGVRAAKNILTTFVSSASSPLSGGRGAPSRPLCAIPSG